MPPDAADALAARRRVAIGDEVRRLRHERGWTQEDLAHRAGVDRKSVNRLETGAYSPSLDRVFLIADALGARPSALVAAADRPVRRASRTSG